MIQVLLLANKFQFGAIRRELLSRLRTMFPSDMRSVRRIAWDDDFTEAATSFELDDAMVMVKVACKLGLADILPAALYYCAQLPIEDVFTAVRDGLPIVSDGFSLEDLQLCMTFRSKLQEANVQVFGPLIVGEVSDDCSSLKGKRNCALVISAILRRAYHEKRMGGDADVLWHAASTSLLERDETPHVLGDPDPGILCRACFSKLKREMDKAENEIWNAMYVEYGPQPSMATE